MGRRKKEITAEKKNAYERYADIKRKNKKVSCISVEKVNEIIENHTNLSFLVNGLSIDEKANSSMFIQHKKEEIKKELLDDFLRMKSKKEREIFEKAKLSQITSFGFAPIDVATITEKNIEDFDVFFCNVPLGSKTKEENELRVPFEFVLEVGSAGLKYDDMYFKCHQGGDFKIRQEDLIEDINNETAQFWRKKDCNGFELIPGKQIKSKYGDDSFLFSPAANGKSNTKVSNLIKINKWFEDGDFIFNVKLVLYTKKRIDFLEIDDESLGATELKYFSVDVPYCDAQVVVYMDGMDAKDIIEDLTLELKEIEDEKKRFAKELSKLKNKERTISKQMSLQDWLNKDERTEEPKIVCKVATINGQEVSDYKKELEMKQKVLKEKMIYLKKAIKLVESNQLQLIEKNVIRLIG